MFEQSGLLYLENVWAPSAFAVAVLCLIMFLASLAAHDRRAARSLLAFATAFIGIAAMSLTVTRTVGMVCLSIAIGALAYLWLEDTRQNREGLRRRRDERAVRGE